VLLELGGKDPMIVLKDADLDRAANAAAWGSCFMTGQVCISVERIYVEKQVASEFQEKLIKKLQSLRTGPTLNKAEMDFGPFIGPMQVAVVETLLTDALERGATVLTGGRRLEAEGGGVYFQPTLITDVDHTMRIMREELFGPVVGLMVVENEEEAIAKANDSEFGLNASVWTKNLAHGIELAQRIESGNVCVNDCVLNAGVPALPFGGAKQSGVGSRHGGADGLRQFCLKQSVMIATGSKKSEMTWFPYRAKTARQLEGLMRLLYGR
jgi:acyl-CoA reductase-like NAD-dependent aldehyde dehydrogenase